MQRFGWHVLGVAALLLAGTVAIASAAPSRGAKAQSLAKALRGTAEGTTLKRGRLTGRVTDSGIEVAGAHKDGVGETTWEFLASAEPISMTSRHADGSETLSYGPGHLIHSQYDRGPTGVIVRTRAVTEHDPATGVTRRFAGFLRTIQRPDGSVTLQEPRQLEPVRVFSASEIAGRPLTIAIGDQVIHRVPPRRSRRKRSTAEE